MIEQIKMALRNIRKRKKRAALTMLGVFIGIAAVVALISLGQGLQYTINQQFEKVGADKIIVQAKEAAGFTGQSAPGKMTERELTVTERAPAIKQTAGVLYRAIQVQFNRVQRTLFIASVPETQREATLATAVNLWEADQGRLLTHKDSDKIVIGYNIANKKTFGKNARVGDTFLISNQKFKVVGTLKRTGDPGLDNGLVMPEQNMRDILNESDAYSMIFAQTEQGVNPDEVAERIERLIRRDRHQDEGKEDFMVQTSTELIESFNKVFNIVQIVFIGIAAISLLVGGIGIMNTMYTSVLERTREIGVMKAIGAQNKDILITFLVESALLGLTGGSIGILIGAGISKSVELIVNNSFGPGTLLAIYPVQLIFGVLIFAILIGAISGILPAKRAASLKPVEALRYE
ncbi:hypothetical protein COV18_04870 [Candidatus Woesearchaeota archaeon CG10_big_fil_rev_8_21_14_0_10_37_12]|nr:MAG: hypothetical protein COV18_04870 [Candidatus Woesearchaeota archaeon CG10_big_fil_rev_8_21_14_0_10_37_12]